MSNIDPELERIRELRTEAARKRYRSVEQTRQALEALEVYIQQYDDGLRVCPEIRKCMNINPWLKECYPRYWEACAGN